MSRSTTSKPRRIASEQARYRKLGTDTYVLASPDDKYRATFSTTFDSINARRIRAKITRHQHAVLDTILALWRVGQRDIETSIAQINTELEAISIQIRPQHISTAIAGLQSAGVLRKIESRHNRLVLRINPHLSWKGRPPARARALAEEADMWRIIEVDD